MAAYTAIAEVSRTLLGVLREDLTSRDDLVSLDAEHIALVDPQDVREDDQTRLSLSLYHLEENASIKNSQPRHPTDPNVTEKSPLAIDLYYLVSAHAGGSEKSTAQRLEQQRIFGLALQTFHDNAILSDDQLTDGLEGDGPLTVSLVNQSLSEKTARRSAAPDTADLPSVLYHVRSAVIDSRHKEPVTHVTDRETSLSRHAER